MPSDAQTLTTDAACLDCIPADMRLPVLISIFARLAGMSTDAQTLTTNASCLQCIPVEMQMPVLIYLAQNIISAGSTVQVYQDYAPGTPPANPLLPAFSYPTGGGTTSQWDVASQTWV